VAIARAARSAGSEVQIVGKVGEDPSGDAVLLDLAKAGIGHVALLRDPSRPTGEANAAVDPDVEPFDDDAEARTGASSTAATDAPPLDAEDIELALRYLSDYRVIVVADPLAEASLAVVARAASWASAALVVVTPAGVAPAAELPPDATVFEAPPTDPDGTFAGVIGSYASAIDQGSTPTDAFARIAETAGWARTTAAST
jgi:hypothetical protein